jgi:hypothetical protein
MGRCLCFSIAGCSNNISREEETFQYLSQPTIIKESNAFVSFSQRTKSLSISHTVRNALWSLSTTTSVPNLNKKETPHHESIKFGTNMELGRNKYTGFSRCIMINNNTLLRHREGASFPATKPQHKFRIKEEDSTKRINFDILIQSRQQ